MKGVVYRIYDNTNGNVYYGSTTETVSRRMASHRSSYKKYLNGTQHYIKSFDILKNGDYSYNIVEEVEYENKYELHNRERFYIENNECVNKLVPNRNKKQYYEDNKDKILEKKKNYHKNNKDKFKQYREDNKDKIKQKDKKYYQNNKDKINEKQKEKITCECGCIVSRTNLNRHKKSKKHLKLI
mgnify:CR=1 FL=1|tara:strand:- start:156 stop:707 length:552 start_codon:yes stop_codon:yes gene_type:complete